MLPLIWLLTAASVTCILIGYSTRNLFTAVNGALFVFAPAGCFSWSYMIMGDEPSIKEHIKLLLLYCVPVVIIAAIDFVFFAQSEYSYISIARGIKNVICVNLYGSIYFALTKLFRSAKFSFVVTAALALHYIYFAFFSNMKLDYLMLFVNNTDYFDLSYLLWMLRYLIVIIICYKISLKISRRHPENISSL